MKRVCLALVIVSVFAAAAYAAPWSGSGTYSVGSGGDYATLGDFFFAMTGLKQGDGLCSTTITQTAIEGQPDGAANPSKFLTEVQVGDYIIYYNGLQPALDIRQVTSVVSDTRLLATPAASATRTLQVYEIYRPGTAAVSGAVIVEVQSNTTEPKNIPILKNLAGFTLTVKAKAAIQPIVTFTRYGDNAGFSGRIIVGCGLCTYNEIFNTVDNVTFDGSNSGGTSRDMTFVAAGNYDYDGFFNVIGKNDMTVIKNLNMYHNSTNTGSNKNCVRFTHRTVTAPQALPTSVLPYEGAGTYEPDGWQVLNNVMKKSVASARGPDQTIISTNSGTLGAGVRQDNYVIDDNYIQGRFRGIFLNNYGLNGNIRRNTIAVAPGWAGLDSFGILFNNSNTMPAPQTSEVSGNWIYVESPTWPSAAGYGPNGIMMGSAGTGATIVYNVFNNMIVCKTTNTYASTWLSDIKGIYQTSYVTWNDYHNSVSLPNNPNLTGQNPSADYGIGGWASGAYYATLRNNIIFAGQQGAACITRANLGTGSFSSDYNDLYCDPSAFIGREVAVDYNFAGWQGLGAGHDLNSKNLDPLGVWLSSSALHLGAGASSAWVAPALGGGPAVDIDGEARAANPFKGADEARLATASFAPTSYDFGLIAKEATKDWTALQITNTSVTSPTLIISPPGLNVSGANPDKFSGIMDPPFPIKIAPAGSAYLTVRYAPGGVNNVSHSASVSPIANVASPSCTLTAGTYNDVTDIWAARQIGTGTVRLTDRESTVTVATNGLNAGRNQFFIQDDSTSRPRALMVDDPSFVAAQTYAMGDAIPANTVIGTLSTDGGGMMVITPYVAWAAPSAGSLPTPLVIAPSVTDFEKLEAMLVRLNSADIGSAGNWAANTSYPITDPLGRATDTIRIEDNSTLVGDAIPALKFDIIGVAVDSGVEEQIQPRIDADIITPATRVNEWSMF